MYQYEPLPSGVRYGPSKPLTRIFHLEPGVGDEPICGRLEITNAEKTQPYEALSYCWGPGELRSRVWIQNDFLLVKDNLATALQALRLKNEVRRLWIDALCIDQSSVEERSRQVRYMRLIYKHCARVTVWLGPAIPGIEEAFATAARIAECETLIREALSSPPATQGDSGQGNVVGANDEVKADMLSNIMADLPQSSIQSLDDLFQKDYFRRVWVLQEVTVGPNPTAKCGDLEMSFRDLVRCGEFVSHFRERGRDEIPNGLVWRSLIAQHEQPRSGTAEDVDDVQLSLGSLAHLLGLLRAFKATDDRDKIYSLLGISDEGLQPMQTLIQSSNPDQYLEKFYKPVASIQSYVNARDSLRDFTTPAALKPDYSKDTVVVYTDVIRHIIKTAPGSLKILSHVQHYGEPDTDAYPSWVPKWYEKELYRPFLYLLGYYHAGKWDMPVGTLWRLRPATWSDAVAHPRRLRVEGFRVGVVQRVSDPLMMIMGDDQDDTILHAWAQLFSFPMVPRPAPAYRSGEPLDEAFCRALSAGILGVAAGSGLSNSGMGLFPSRPKPSLEEVQQLSRRGIRGFLTHLAEKAGISQTILHPFHDSIQKDIALFRFGVHYYTMNRRVFLTQSGHIGIGPRAMQQGDEVVVLYRGDMPYVLRRRPDHYVFVGDCYVEDDDIMLGKMAHNAQRGIGQSVTTFELR